MVQVAGVDDAGGLTVAPEVASVATARAFVTRVCRRTGVDPDLTDTVVLLTSEVVTNAIIHGRSEARVVVDAHPGRVRVQVGDDNSRHPQRVEQDPDALDGRGMAVVEMLARAWGVRDEPGGKVVWFDVVA